MVKRILALSLLMVVLLGLSGCGDGVGDQGDQTDTLESFTDFAEAILPSI